MLESILHFLRSLYEPEGLKELIRSGGAPLVCTIVFVETGFFVGFFLPGDSLLVTAGIFAAAGVVPLRWLLAPVMACAIFGDQIGYWIGRKAGPEVRWARGDFCAICADYPDVLPAGGGSRTHAIFAVFLLRYHGRRVLGWRDDFGRVLPGAVGA